MDFIAGVAEVAGISKKDAGIALEAVLSQLTTAFSKVYARIPFGHPAHWHLAS